MTEWEHETVPLRRHHGWRAKRGFNLFVADRGAVRFLVPRDWVPVPTEDCIRIYDRAPPDDEAAIGVSVLPLPAPDVPIPPRELLDGANAGDGLDIVEIGPPVEGRRPGIRLAWRQLRHRDPSGRDAFSRACVALGRGVCAFLTLDFWVDDLERVAPVWEEILASLELGRYVADPSIGDVDQN